MKEKIGIEKLIELYYEYGLNLLKRDMYVNGATEREIEVADIEKVDEDELEKNLNKLSDLKPFIKWLVENDKIRKDIYRPIPRIKATYEGGVVYHDKLEDRIIMILSISSSPIDDLILYLK